MYLILILLYIYTISHYTDLTIFGVAEGSQWWSYFTYSYIHITWTHLVINSFAFLSYWNIIKRMYNKYLLFFLLIIIPAVSAYFAVSEQPTIGLSALVYTMFGLYLPMVLHRKDRIKMYFLFIFSFVITLLFVPAVNSNIHFISFALSLVPGYIRRYYADK